MPVKSLHSSVRTWPDVRTVDRAVRQWASEVGQSRKDVLRIGYFGSYAQGDWGVGSDLDLSLWWTRPSSPLKDEGPSGM